MFRGITPREVSLRYIKVRIYRSETSSGVHFMSRNYKQVVVEVEDSYLNNT